MWTPGDDRALPPPRVRCGDGVCRHTFVHCFRAMAPKLRGAQEGMLDRLLGDAATAERERRLERALPFAVPLLRALASYHQSARELFAATPADACAGHFCPGVA